MTSIVERVHTLMNELFTMASISFEEHLEELAHLLLEHRVKEGLDTEDVSGAPLGAATEGGGGLMRI
jgi:hypothetical protein